MRRHSGHTEPVTARGCACSCPQLRGANMHQTTLRSVSTHYFRSLCVCLRLLQNSKDESPLTSLVLVMVSAMMLAAPGSSVSGINGREEAEEADGVTAEGVTASSEQII